VPYSQVMQDDLRYPPIGASVAGFLQRFQPPLPRLLTWIDQAVREADPRIDRTVATILSDYVGEADLLAGIACPSSDERYARHLLHAGQGYSVLAVVWRPGQMSAVHGHQTWCALGVHRGSLTESLFGHDKKTLRLIGCKQHHPGAISHSPADGEAIHRIANLGTETAVSIHVYGVGFDRLGEGVNRVWAD
jgi:predicted metal-dependent enzyme (double-stranded beta helix superfamily)